MFGSYPLWGAEKLCYRGPFCRGLCGDFWGGLKSGLTSIARQFRIVARAPAQEPIGRVLRKANGKGRRHTRSALRDPTAYDDLCPKVSRPR